MRKGEGKSCYRIVVGYHTSISILGVILGDFTSFIAVNSIEEVVVQQHCLETATACFVSSMVCHFTAYFSISLSEGGTSNGTLQKPCWREPFFFFFDRVRF